MYPHVLKGRSTEDRFRYPRNTCSMPRQLTQASESLRLVILARIPGSPNNLWPSVMPETFLFFSPKRQHRQPRFDRRDPSDTVCRNRG